MTSPKQHGGAGRGQGRPLTVEQFAAMVARISRMVDRLEKQATQPSPDLVLSAVRLNIQVNRLLVLLGIERPPELSEAEREAAHAWAVQAVSDEAEAELRDGEV